MNKTIIININGIVFHIEEDAYEILKSYMTEVKRHFAYSSDSDEIVTDIENRLAEMFNEKLSTQNKQVIVLSDVEEVTSQMGRASDFEAGENDHENFNQPEFKSSRSLYRDEDEKMIAGVCAGLGHYFELEAKWVRLIALLSILVSGVGLIPYLVLWIVLPAAKTRQEKMAMKGEALNLQNFKRTFDEESQGPKNSDTMPHNLSYSAVSHSDPIKEIVIFIGKGLKFILKSIIILVIGAGCFALFALIIVLLVGVGFINDTDFNTFPMNAINPEYQSQIFFSAFLLLIIPMLALIFFGLRVLLNRSVVSRYGAFSMLILWLTGIFMGLYYGSKIAAEFKEEGTVEQQSDLKAYDTLSLKLNPKLFFNADDSLKYNIGHGKVKGRISFGKNNLDKEMRRNIDLFIEKSDDGKLSIVKELNGRGKNMEDAVKAAQRINYQIKQQDSIIQFDKYMSLSGTGLYRAQKLDLRLKVPLNTRLIIDGNLNDRINHYNLGDCAKNHGNYNYSSTWVMTERGLKCADDGPEQKTNE
jgi:phage shock protein PspC (stress-responsive transcriptional regulator)